MGGIGTVVRTASALLAAALCALALAACTDAGGQTGQPATGAPERFAFSVSGWMGTVTTVDWDGRRLRRERRDWGTEPGSGTLTVAMPAGAEWDGFRRVAERLGVWRWREDYTRHDVYDGTHWRLELEVDGRAVRSGGGNGYPPDGDGPAASEDFQRLREAVDALFDRAA